MGTLRRDVNRAFASLKKLLSTPIRFRRQKHAHEMVRDVGQAPVVQGFTPYFFAPSMQERIQHAERAIERWFQEFVVDQHLRFKRNRDYKRPVFYQPLSTVLHYIHRGHRHRWPKVKNRAQRRAAI